VVHHDDGEAELRRKSLQPLQRAHVIVVHPRVGLLHRPDAVEHVDDDEPRVRHGRNPFPQIVEQPLIEPAVLQRYMTI
jgi:hypothetical protein